METGDDPLGRGRGAVARQLRQSVPDFGTNAPWILAKYPYLLQTVHTDAICAGRRTRGICPLILMAPQLQFPVSAPSGSFKVDQVASSYRFSLYGCIVTRASVEPSWVKGKSGIVRMRWRACRCDFDHSWLALDNQSVGHAEWYRGLQLGAALQAGVRSVTCGSASRPPTFWI